MNIHFGSLQQREKDQDAQVVVSLAASQQFLESFKEATVKTISIKAEGDKEFNVRSFLIQTRRVLTDGGRVSVFPTTAISEEELVSASKLAGYGSKIEKGKENEYIFTKKVQKKFRLASKKKEEEKKVEISNPWADLGNHEDVIDDTELLEKDSQNLFKKFAKVTDCMQKAKPCDNCTCGRAMKQFGKKPLENGQVQSSCGKCYMGDAYRCAGCPYLGTPAFAPGDQVKLVEGGDQAAVPMEREEGVATSSKGKVKIVL